MEVKAGGITLNVIPRVDWSVLHGELTSALFDEFKHFTSVLLHRDCPVCSK